MNTTDKDNYIINCGELRHNYQRLAIEILRTTIKLYQRGDISAKQFLFAKTDEKALRFWASIAEVSVQTIRDRAKSIKKIPSPMIGIKYHQTQPSKHKRVGRSNKNNKKGDQV